MKKKSVDPRYHTVPRWELVRMFGNDWLREQSELFDEIMKESK